MKLTKFIPAKLFKPKKCRSVSRSETDPPSFSSITSSSASDDIVFQKPDGLATPTSVLPSPPVDEQFDLKQAFEIIDADGDGKIRKEDLESLLCRVGAAPLCPEELKMMLGEVDKDGDGCISLEDLYTIGSAFALPVADGDLREAFDFFDSDRDGKITAEELLNVFKTIGDARCTLEDCRRMIGEVDRNGDGFVCFEDFSLMMDHQQRR